MEVKYRKDTDGAYMILPGETECEVYAARMLCENRIEGVMPLAIREMDGEKEYCFDISCGRTMSCVLQRRPLTMNEISSLVSSLCRMADHMEEYLMNINHVIIDPGMICLPMESHRGPGGYERMEPDFGRAVFCCHPAYEKDFLEQVRELIRFFLNKADHTDAKGVEAVYELFQISQKEYFRLEELEEVCRENEERPAAQSDSSRQGNSVSSSQDTEENSPDLAAECLKEECRGIKKAYQGRDDRDGFRRQKIMRVGSAGDSRNFWLIPAAAGILLSVWNLYRYLFYGEIRREAAAAGGLFLAAGVLIRLAERVIGSRRRKERKAGKSVGGGQAAEHRTESCVSRDRAYNRGPVLVSENLLVQENIYIRKLPFVLGKKAEVSDGILDCPTVSRCHAQISGHSGEYFLEDCGSTNGTFLNGSQLIPERYYPLEAGDEVTLADRRFIFQYA